MQQHEQVPGSYEFLHAGDWMIQSEASDQSFSVHLPLSTVSEFQIFFSSESAALDIIKEQGELLFSLQSKFSRAMADRVVYPYAVPEISLSEKEIAIVGRAVLQDLKSPSSFPGNTHYQARRMNFRRDAFVSLKEGFFKAGGNDPDGELALLEARMHFVF